MSGAAVRTALLGPGTMPRTCALRLQCARPADNVLALLLSSRDGRSTWEVGISGANAVIQSRDIAGVVTPGASAAHGLTAGVPFTLEARLINNVTLALHLNGAASPVVSYDIPGGLYANNRNYGFASAVTGAMVLSAELCSLLANVSDRETALVVVAGGDVWIISESGEARMVRAGAFGPTAQVSLVDFDQKVYGVDGAAAWVIDPKAYTCSAWGGTTATTALPGASETSPGSGVYIAGTTRMRIVRRFLTRVVLAGDPQDPQNVWLSAIGSGTDFNTAADTPGKAWALSVDLPGRIGEPVVAIEQVARGVLGIGCTSSVWELRGDPALGIPQVENRAMTLGPSGPNAMFVGDSGRMVFHAPSGVFVLAGPGEPIPLSEHTLRDRITIAPADVGSYNVQVTRDPEARETYVFLTMVDEPSDAEELHFAYEEAVGGWDPKAGGWQPDDYDSDIGPTASGIWNNRLVIGTRTGYLLVRGTEFNDDGLAYGSLLCVRMDDGDELTETLLNGVLVTPTADSDPILVSVFQGLTAELAEETATGIKVLEETVDGPARLIARPVRGTALVLRISNGNLDQGFRLESLEIDAEPGAALRRRTRTTTTATPSRSPYGDLGAAASAAAPGVTAGPGAAPVVLAMMPTAANNFGGNAARYARWGAARPSDLWVRQPGDMGGVRRPIGGWWGAGGDSTGDPGQGGSGGGITYKGGTGAGGGGEAEF